MRITEETQIMSESQCHCPAHSPCGKEW